MYSITVASIAGEGKLENQDVCANREFFFGNKSAVGIALGDGHGNRGFLAADIATRTALASLAKHPNIETAYGDASAQVDACKSGTKDSSGTTLDVIVANHKGLVTVGHLGDGRAYKIAPDGWEQLTHEHVEYLTKDVPLEPTFEQIVQLNAFATTPRSLGHRMNKSPTVTQHLLAPGEAIVLASDGAWPYIHPDELCTRLDSAHPARAALERALRPRRLASLYANADENRIRAPGSDDATVIYLVYRGAK